MPLLVFGVQARADAPPVGVWVELQVDRCDETLFEAPPDAPSRYVSGTNYRTAFVMGSVVTAGLQPYDESQAWIRDWVERVRGRLPTEGSTQTLVLPRWDAAFCQSAMGKLRRFAFVYSCDTSPSVGACLPPHQLARPVSVPPQDSH